MTYKTAWRMFNKIRGILGESVTDLEGQIEADETYIGGRKRGLEYRGGAKKAIFAGIVERRKGTGRIHAYVAKGKDDWALTDTIAERVMPGSMIFTDEAPWYKRLSALGYQHRRIHHRQKIYVQGDIHTNTIEGFWGNTKRGLSGVYHAISRKHLQGYLNEYTFRYNHRRDQRPMFRAFCSRIGRDVSLSRRTAA